MEPKNLKGNTEQEIWQQIEQDLNAEPELLQYSAFINQNGQQLLLDIDIDLGGGFESGFASTILSTSFSNPAGFSFAIHPQHLTDVVGKAFGMQDVVIGDPTFDEAMILKTNNEQQLKQFLSDATIKEALLALPNFTLEAEPADEDEVMQGQSSLELFIEQGITNAAQLKPVYFAFSNMINALKTLQQAP